LARANSFFDEHSCHIMRRNMSMDKHEEEEEIDIDELRNTLIERQREREARKSKDTEL